MASAAMARAQAMMPLVDNEVRLALSIEANVETANRLVGAHPPQKGGVAYNEMARALTLFLALTVAKLFELPKLRKGEMPADRDLRSDVASVPILLNFLRDGAFRAELVAEARQWTPFMADEQATACERAIDEAIASYAYCETDDGRAALAKLSDLRNKVIAHSLTAALNALPTYDELFRLTDVARDVCGHASLAVRGRQNDVKAYEKRMMNAAIEFWTPVMSALARA